MLPTNYVYEVQIKRQEFERAICQRALAKLVFPRRENRLFQTHAILVRLGSWLIRQGEYLETRYSECTEACVPARTASAR